MYRTKDRVIKLWTIGLLNVNNIIKWNAQDLISFTSVANQIIVIRCLERWSSYGRNLSNLLHVLSERTSDVIALVGCSFESWTNSLILASFNFFMQFSWWCCHWASKFPNMKGGKLPTWRGTEPCAILTRFRGERFSDAELYVSRRGNLTTGTIQITIISHKGNFWVWQCSWFFPRFYFLSFNHLFD